MYNRSKKKRTDTMQIGLTKETMTKVTEANTAAAVKSGTLPVFATPMMIALMEEAAASLVEEHLDREETSVGILMNVKHTAATPVGMNVRAKAEITAIDGRKITFKVEAFDEKEKIGEGVHERFIVKSEKFLNKANGKKS